MTSKRRELSDLEEDMILDLQFTLEHLVEMFSGKADATIVISFNDTMHKDVLLLSTVDDLQGLRSAFNRAIDASREQAEENETDLGKH